MMNVKEMKDKKDFDWKNMTPQKKFWCKVHKNPNLFWRMMKNQEIFDKKMEQFGIKPEDCPEFMKLLKEKKQFIGKMKCKKGWKKGGCHPMKKFWRKMMWGGKRRHGHKKHWRRHQENEMSYEDQLQQAIHRSLGLEEKPEEKVEENTTSSNTEGTTSNTSDNTSSDNTSSDSSSTSEDEQPAQQPNLANLIQQGL